MHRPPRIPSPRIPHSPPQPYSLSTRASRITPASRIAPASTANCEPSAARCQTCFIFHRPRLKRTYATTTNTQYATVTATNTPFTP